MNVRRGRQGGFGWRWAAAVFLAAGSMVFAGPFEGGRRQAMIGIRVSMMVASVTVGGQTKFVCVDGPEFDGHLVEFDQMIQRLGSYREQEKLAAAGCNLHDEAVKKGLK